MYIVIVNTARGTEYLDKNGGLRIWSRDAKRFPTLQAAKAIIDQNGWDDTTSIKPGRITAYVGHDRTC